MFTGEDPAALVVLGVVLLRSALMYLALGVCVVMACVCIGFLLANDLYIKRGESLFW